MNQAEFKSKLMDSLDILTEDVKKEEVQVYIEKIEQGLKDGLDEKTIISSFGTIDSIQKSIYLKHGINPDLNRNKKNTGFFYKQFQELFQVIHNVVDQMAKNTMKDNIKIILDILVLIFFICILKVPFIFVRNLVDNVLLAFDYPTLLTVWGIVIDIIYIIVAIMVFISVFTKWFKNIKETKDLPRKKNDL